MSALRYGPMLQKNGMSASAYNSLLARPDRTDTNLGHA
jgi:hypothetical protein